MLEIGIRTFSLKGGTKISNDYREQMDLIRRWMKGKIQGLLGETENTCIYQYYSMAPFYCAETKFLRRMQVGSSVMCITESMTDYIASIRIPKIMKKGLFWYLRMFLDSLDYIVITDEKTEEKLRQEGVKNPHFHVIPTEKGEEILTASLWMNFYQKIADSM